MYNPLLSEEVGEVLVNVFAAIVCSEASYAGIILGLDFFDKVLDNLSGFGLALEESDPGDSS